MRPRQPALIGWCLLSSLSLVLDICLPNVVGEQLLLLLRVLLAVLLLLRMLEVLLLYVYLLLPRSCWLHGYRLAYIFVHDPTIHPLE